MYCTCSFLSVTLVCPPMGPPGTVLSAGTGGCVLTVACATSCLACSGQSASPLVLPSAQRTSGALPLHQHPRWAGSDKEVPRVKRQVEQGLGGQAGHSVLKSASMKMGSVPVSLAMASRSR